MGQGGRTAVRIARGFAWALVALVGLLAVATVGLPLVVRGPVLSRLVALHSQNVCGAVSLEGGHVSVGVAAALLFQRPFDIALDGMAISEPEGEYLFRARQVRLRLKVLRHPWRVEVERASLAHGAWGLVDQGLGQITVALRPIPRGGRAACRTPPPPSTKPPRQGEIVTIRNVRLHDMSVGLDFPVWAVKLDSIDARGSVQVRGTATGMQYLFDAHDIDAKWGGSLRVGPRGQRLTPVVPFDRVRISRVAVVDSEPRNLQLEVREGRTAQAVLSGKAVFNNILGPKPPGPKPPGARAGMDLDARWTELGQALGHSPAWAAVGKQLAKLNAGLRVSLHGPFAALTGNAELAGKGGSLQARLLADRRYELDVRLDKLDTNPLVPRSRRALLGGRLDGQIAVRAKLGRTVEETSISVDRLELDLLRSRPANGPQRVVISRAAGASSGKELRIGLGRVALEREVFRVESLRARGPGVKLATSLRAEREKGARGFLFEAAQTSDSRLAVAGETFVLPPRIRARFDPGRALAVEPFSIRHAGGGAIDVGGSLRVAGSVDLRAAVRDYPLARIPGLAGVHPPGTKTTVSQALRGRLDASFQVAGPTKQPALSGVLALTGMGWAQRRLGDGRLVFHGVGGGTRFDGTLLDGLDVQGEVRLRPDQRMVTLHGRADLSRLQPVLAALPLREVAGVIAADLRWEAAAAGKAATAKPEISGTIEVVERVSVWPDRLPGSVGVSPTRIELAGDEVRVPKLAVRIRGAEAIVAGRVHHIDWNRPAEGVLEGTVLANAEGGGLARWLGIDVAGSGAAHFGGELSGSVGAPRVGGQAQFDGLTINWSKSPAGAVRVDGPLRIDGANVAVGPLMLRFANGGWIKIAGSQGSGRLTLQRGRGPLPVSDLDLTVQGGGLGTVRPVAGLTVQDLALNLRVAEVGEGRLRVGGDVRLGHNVFDLKNRPKDEKKNKPSPSPRRRDAPSALDRVSIDVRLTGPDDAVKVRVPYAPDVTIGLRCLIQGPLKSPHMMGEVRGSNAYSRVALAAADRFSDRDLRQCDLGPR